uniref:Uncharacterized protein n=1 Tax=Romanomermis culicivorax TaxID=13658 RepID=A0A915I9A8_ROMCU
MHHFGFEIKKGFLTSSPNDSLSSNLKHKISKKPTFVDHQELKIKIYQLNYRQFTKLSIVHYGGQSTAWEDLGP